jgi:hypothetical protein
MQSIWRTSWWSDSDSGSQVPAPDANPQSPSTLEIMAEYGGKALFSLGVIAIGVLVGAAGCLIFLMTTAVAAIGAFNMMA